MIERIKSFEKKFFFIALIITFIIPSVFLMMSLINREPINWYQIIIGGIFTYFITITITFFNIGIANNISRKFPWKEGLTRRLLIETACSQQTGRADPFGGPGCRNPFCPGYGEGGCRMVKILLSRSDLYGHPPLGWEQLRNL